MNPQFDILLTDEIASFLKKQKLGFVATVSADNTPNLSPKGTIIVWDNEHLAFADIRSPDTIKNLKTNPNLEINVIDPIVRKGYLFKGKAKILHEGQLYEKILNQYRNNGVQSPIGDIVLVNITHIENVTSPLYDMGVSEDEIKSKWKKHFLEY
ncbi:MAG: pyridoxamine 5'-phosphate oxidase family protein [Nitrosopumilaceae archaeon]|nr:pyridoxamine 5'-phosphate oxidase family protein [Nitrosopumilaceae archaeon]